MVGVKFDTLRIEEIKGRSDVFLLEIDVWDNDGVQLFQDGSFVSVPFLFRLGWAD
jgi:hypothetical protein